MQKIKIGLVGCGTVGSALVQRIVTNSSIVENRLGIKIELVSVLVKNINKKRSVEIDSSLLTDNKEIFFSNEIDIVVEVVGGLGDIEEYIQMALEKKIPVVTANKELISNKGFELFKTAEEHSVDLLCEAAVAGGIPVVRALRSSLLGEDINKIAGILNGTCNFILTKMTEEGLSYDKALAQAQELGFAEPDPYMDVSGKDSASKIAILASIGFGVWITNDKVSSSGVDTVSKHDIDSANKLGYTIKLIAKAQKMSVDKYCLSVSPTFVANENPLANIRNEYNAVMIDGVTLGDVILSGPGAGGNPTAAAVYGDILDIAQNIVLNRSGAILKVVNKALDENLVEPVQKYYVSFIVKDESGVLSKVAKTFADYDISIQQILQSPIVDNSLIRITCYDSKESSFNKCIKVLSEQDFIVKVNQVYSILD